MLKTYQINAEIRDWNREDGMMNSCFSGEGHPLSHAHDGFVHFPQETFEFLHRYTRATKMERLDTVMIVYG
jgi:hypothetical protein